MRTWVKHTLSRSPLWRRRTGRGQFGEPAAPAGPGPAGLAPDTPKCYHQPRETRVVRNGKGKLCPEGYVCGAAAGGASAKLRRAPEPEAAPEPTSSNLTGRRPEAVFNGSVPGAGGRASQRRAGRCRRRRGGRSEGMSGGESRSRVRPAAPEESGAPAGEAEEQGAWGSAEAGRASRGRESGSSACRAAPPAQREPACLGPEGNG